MTSAKNKKPRESNPAVKESIALRRRKHQDALEKERFKMWILFGVILLFCVILLEWGGGEVEDEIESPVLHQVGANELHRCCTGAHESI